MSMDKRGIALSFVVLAFGTAAAAQTTVTMMQGQNAYAGTTDDWIICCTGADLNKGTDNTLGVRGTSDEALIRFAIFAAEGGPVPNGATITSATLSLYKYDGPDAVIQASRVLKAWSEGGATWNSTGTVAWSTPGATGAGTDILATPDGQGSIGDAAANGCTAAPFPDACWINIDVTAGVKAFASGASQNFGWLLTQVSSSAPAQYKNFNSRDNPNFPALRPRLTVTYSGGGPVAPTARLTATPASGPAPLAVQFSASQSADNGSPITSLTLQFGDGQQVTWTDKTVAQSHTYAANGSYTASLTATNAGGTSTAARQTITVGTSATCIPSTLPLSGVAVPTFHSMGLYDNPPAPANGTVFVRYRAGNADPAAAGSWSRGEDIWYDTRGLNTYAARGSVVHLQPNTPYVFELGTGGTYDTATWQHAIAGQAGEACPSTWSESFPVATRLTPFTTTNTTLTTSTYGGSRSTTSRSHVLLANQSGTPNGYVAYDFTGTSAVAQAPNASNTFPVVISGSYIILKGLKTVGGESGIFIDPGSHDIVVDGVNVSGYGRDSGVALGANLTGNQAVNEDAGIKFPDSSYGPILQTKRIVIQNSTIHNPAFGANPWDTGHPSGATAIMMYPTGGQIVIRNNASFSTTTGSLDGPPDRNHFHEDGLVMGGCNDNSPPCDTMGAGLGPDVDIYRNIVMDYFDDGLETDGDGLNNRVWANYFDYGGASAVSSTAVLKGPTYIWRNVYNRQRMFMLQTWGSDPNGRNYMMKAGGLSGNGGRRYIFNNTSMQPPVSSEPDASGTLPLGAGFGIGGTGGTGNEIRNTVSRNNVFEMFRNDHGVFDFAGLPPDPSNDMDFDVTNGNMTNENDGVANAVINYAPGNGWSAYWTGNYRIDSITRNGVAIPNVSQSIPNFNPNPNAPYGAQEGTSPMQIGPGAGGN